jgi:hypothetical protein
MTMIFQGAGQIRSHVGDAIGQPGSEYERARRFQDALRQGMDNSQAAEFVEESYFYDEHRMSRAQWLAARAAWAKDDAKTAVLESVEADTPPYPPVKGSPVAESSYRNYCLWVADMGRDVARLERVLQGTEADREAVPALQARRASLLSRLATRTAAWLSGEASPEEPTAIAVAAGVLTNRGLASATETETQQWQM